MEAAAKVRGFPRSAQWRNYWDLLDCHCNWTAAWHLMHQGAKQDSPPCTVTADYAIKLLRPTPTSGPVFLAAKVVESNGGPRHRGRHPHRRWKSLRNLPRHLRRGDGRPSGLSSLVGPAPECAPRRTRTSDEMGQDLLVTPSQPISGAGSTEMRIHQTRPKRQQPRRFGAAVAFDCDENEDREPEQDGS